MVKKVLNILLLTISLGFVFSSCGSDEQTSFSVTGQWAIHSREIKCFGEGDALGKAQELQKEMQERFDAGIRLNNYIYTFSDYIIDTQSQLYGYSEDVFKKDSDLGIPIRSITGSYTRVDHQLVVYAESLGEFGNWQSTYTIKDLNNKYVMFGQDLTSRDLEIILYVYFGISRKLDAGITGTLITKAMKK